MGKKFAQTTNMTKDYLGWKNKVKKNNRQLFEDRYSDLGELNKKRYYLFNAAVKDCVKQA